MFVYGEVAITPFTSLSFTSLYFFIHNVEFYPLIKFTGQSQFSKLNQLKVTNNLF